MQTKTHSTQRRSTQHTQHTNSTHTLGMMPGHSALARRQSATPSMSPARKPRSVCQSRLCPVRPSTHAAASRRLSASVSGFMLPCRASADAIGDEVASMIILSLVLFVPDRGERGVLGESCVRVRAVGATAASFAASSQVQASARPRKQSVKVARSNRINAPAWLDGQATRARAAQQRAVAFNTPRPFRQSSAA